METTRKVRTNANYRPDDTPKDMGVSMTVPNMVPDLRTMVRRRQTGLAVPIFNATYSQEDYPDLFKMDQIELIQFRETLARDMVDLEKQLKTANKVLEEQQNPSLNHIQLNQEEKI